MIERALPLLAGPPEALHLRARRRQGRPATVAAMLALTAAPGKPGNVELREVADPVPHDHETLVRVRALSLNRGEARNVATFQDGDPVGWDLAGVVERSPADGSGPAVGTRVVGLVRTGAWAELVALSDEHAGADPATT